MAQFVHTVRFVLGMAMLIAGVALVHPLVTMCAPVRAGRPPEVTGAAGSPAESPGVHGVLGASGGGHAIPDVRIAPDWNAEAQVPQAASAPTPLPPAPPPLPPSGLDFSPVPPALAGAYRSTVDIPPPPLLDVHAPPPLAGGWSLPDASPRPVGIAAAQPPAVEAPAAYVVRDGDDLTGIAIRVYGHAGAATAIWDANRDRLADPQLLPIGMALRMPPSWTLPAVTASGGGRPGVIEPTFAGATRVEANRPPAEPDGGAAALPSGRHWLGQPSAPGAATPAALPIAHQPAAAAAPVTRPAKVWVAAGDSLDSIAQRFYGDRSASARILQANRDRLRSPELLVPGMELRLP